MIEDIFSGISQLEGRVELLPTQAFFLDHSIVAVINGMATDTVIIGNIYIPATNQPIM